MSAVRSIIIVQAADQAAANAGALEVDLVGGDRAFTVPLENLAGATVAYVANWQFQDAAARDRLMTAFARRGINARVVREDYADPDPATEDRKLDTVLTRERMKRPEPGVSAQLARDRARR